MEQAVVQQVMFKLLGFIFVGLAALGLALPGLPTTPFLLLAASCFSKTSERWHNWLLSNRTFGPIIKNWEENRCISSGTKIFALSMIAAFGGASVGFFLQNLYARLVVGVFLVWGFLFVARIATCENPKSQSQEA